MERTAAAEAIIAFILLLAVIVLISFFIKLGFQQSNGKKKKKDFFQIYVSVQISYVKFVVVYKYTTIFLSKLVFQEL